jgi:hypothetical protein
VRDGWRQRSTLSWKRRSQIVTKPRLEEAASHSVPEPTCGRPHHC